MKDPKTQIAALQGYYRFHSWIYDMTRWSFLFGRGEILKHIRFTERDDFTLLEVGCGTGKNLEALAKKFPLAKFTGYDLSSDMLRIASKKLASHGGRIRLVTSPYGAAAHEMEKFDAVLFSYTLSMINPQYREVINQVHHDLKIGGTILVVDFCEATTFYKKFMLLNHVRIDSHLLPVLQEFFPPIHLSINQAYFGIWSYFFFVGKNLENKNN